MGLPQPVKRYTPEEYYDLERAAEYKSEYFDGEIFAMAGASFAHVEICTNLIFELRTQLKNNPYRVCGSDLRLRVKATGLRTSPDVSVYCDPFEVDDEDPSAQTATNPMVLFEVLSKSTQTYDRTDIGENYRQIDSLRAHVIIDQHRPYAGIYERQADGAWILRGVRGMEASLIIPPIKVTLPFTEIYAGVDFAPAE